MKKNSRKYLALSLAAVMAIGNFSFASGPVGGYKAAALDIDEKLVGFESINLEVQQDVRIIVELTKAPLIEAATARGLQVEEMNTAEVNAATSAIEVEQASILKQIENVADPEVHQSFTNVFNGLSMTVQGSEVEAIAAMDGVKSVYIANEYERPEPQMRDSHLITQSRWVNEELKYKGEGLVVAIIDTGLDAYHKDFNIDEAALAGVKFTKASVDAAIAAKSLKGQYFNAKVPYGYNYMDNNHIIKDVAPGASMHGMHVGGTVAANGTIKGVAPNAQLLALKVFGNDEAYGSTYSDIIIAAVDDAIALGADVMNLSLGSTAAFVDRNDPEQQSITRAVDNGIVMSISAGNSAHYGNGNTATASKPFTTNPDIGVVGSPGLTAESMQVASVDNITQYENSYEVKVAGKSYIGFSNKPFAANTYQMVALKGAKIGAAADFEGVDVKGKVVLVSRGNAFTDTALNAQAGGAVGVVVYNIAGRDIVTNPVDTVIPLMMIPATGVALEGVIAGAGGVVDADIAFKAGLYNPNSGKSSAFTSWGTTPDLGFKPDIAAPGGNIYSTLENDQYGVMSGTSMAAPHAAGGSALMLQRLNTSDDFKALYSSAAEKAKLAKAILMNTGRAVIDYNYGNELDEYGNYVEWVTYTSPRRQGAGSMDLKSASLTNVVVYDKAQGKSFQASHNAGEVKDAFGFTMTAYNQGTAPAFYSLEAVAQTNLPGSDASKRPINMLESMLLDGVSYTFTVNGQEVTSVEIPAGGSVDISVNFDIKNAVLAHNGQPFFNAYPNGNFVEGFVFLYPQADENNSVVEALKTAYIDAVAAEAANVKKIADLTKSIPLDEANVPVLLEAATAAKALVEATEALIVANEAYLAAQADLTVAQEALAALEADHGTLVEVDAALKLFADYDAALAEKALKEDALAAAEAVLATANAQLVNLQGQLTVQTTELARVEALLAEELAKKKPNEALVKSYQDLIAGIKLNILGLEAQITAKNTEITVATDALSAAQAAFAAAETALTDVVLALEAISLTPDSDRAPFAAAKVALEAATAEVAAKQVALDALVKLTDAELEQIAKLDELKTLAQEAQKAHDDLLVKIAADKEALKAAQDGKAGFAANTEAMLKAYMDGTQAYRQVMPLSFPYISFNGQWAKAPAFDEVRRINGVTNPKSFYGMTSLLYNNTAEDSGYFMGAVSAFSPNGDEVKDEIAPIVSFTRNLKDVTMTIENAAGEVIKTVGYVGEQRKDYFDGRAGGNYSYFPGQIWNGKVNLKTAKEGVYNYVISGKLDDAAKTLKSIKFPVMLDITAPTFKQLSSDKGIYTVAFTDNLSGISHYALFKEVDGEPVLLKNSVVNGKFDLLTLGVKAGDKLIFASVDNAGNVGIGAPISVEKVMPALSGLSFREVGADPASYSFDTDGIIKFTGTVTEQSPYKLTIGGVLVKNEVDFPAAPFNFEHTYVAAQDGKQEIVINATDVWGNVNEFKRHLFVDLHAPKVEIQSVKAGETVLEVKDGVFVTPAGTENITVTLKATDNYPDLTINVNESFAFGVYKDYYSTRTELKPVEKVLTYTFKVDKTETQHPLLIEVVDAAGWKTSVGYTGYVGTPGENLFKDLKPIVVVPRIEGGKDFESNGSTPSNPPAGNTGSGTGTGSGTVVTPPAPVNPTPVNPTPVNPTPVVPVTPAPVAPVVPTPVDEEITIDENQTPQGAVAFTKAYVNGVKADLFSPNANVTRAEFAKMLAVVLGLDLSSEKTGYQDANNAWYTAYIAALDKAGIMKGYSATSFKPNQTISRAEIAQALAKAYEFQGQTVVAKANDLKDIAGHKAETAIAKLVGKGVINGFNGFFRPDASATRAEAVKMMNLFSGRTVNPNATSRFADVKGHWAEAHIAAASEDFTLTMK